VWADYTGILGEPHYITTWIKLTVLRGARLVEREVVLVAWRAHEP
jgi:hypothetical protein